MQKNPSWVWKTYLVVYAMAMMTMASMLFHDEFHLGTFYQIRMAFDQRFLASYLLAAGAVILNTLSIVPIYLYIYRLDFLRPEFWQVFLSLRIAFDLQGHLYETRLLQAIFVDDKEIALRFMLAIAAFILPSYIAIMDRAFPATSSSPAAEPPAPPPRKVHGS